MTSAAEKIREMQTAFINDIASNIKTEKSYSCVCAPILFSVDATKPFESPTLKQAKDHFNRQGFKVWYQPRFEGKHAWDDSESHKFCVGWEM